MDINRLDPRMVEGGSGSGGSGYEPTDPVALNKISQSGGLPTWNGSAWPGGSSSGGDMFKAVYDPDGDGKFAYTVLPAAGTVAGTYAAGDDSRFHTHINATSLAKITESSGLPLWNGAAWPSAVPGMTAGTLLYNYTYGLGNITAPQLLKLTGGLAVINNSATVTNGAGGDARHELAVVRDLRNATDFGIVGHVNNAAFVHTVTKNGPANQFEWNLTCILDNLSTGAGENCAIYTQGNAYTSCGTWGGCFQVVDYEDVTNSAGYKIGAEIDCGVSGDCSNAVGALVVAQDAKEITGRGNSADKRARTGVDIGASGGARWRQGLKVGEFCDEGILCYQYGTYAYTGLKALQSVRLQGDYSTAFMNLQHGTAPKGIVINTDCTLSTGLAVDIGANHGYGVNGQKVVGARKPKWGYATAANIAEDNAGGSAFYRFDPNTDFKSIAEIAIPAADLTTLKVYVALLYKAWGALITDLRAEQGHGLIGS